MGPGGPLPPGATNKKRQSASQRSISQNEFQPRCLLPSAALKELSLTFLLQPNMKNVQRWKASLAEYSCGIHNKSPHWKSGHLLEPPCCISSGINKSKLPLKTGP